LKTVPLQINILHIIIKLYGEEEGVIGLKEKQEIILKAALEGKTQRQIAKEMKISRTTVAKYILCKVKYYVKLPHKTPLKQHYFLILTSHNKYLYYCFEPV
jgi:ATP-dependent Lon protease